MAGKQKCRCAGREDSWGRVVGTGVDQGEGNWEVRKGERVISEEYPWGRRGEVEGRRGRRASLGGKVAEAGAGTTKVRGKFRR